MRRDLPCVVLVRVRRSTEASREPVERLLDEAIAEIVQAMGDSRVTSARGPPSPEQGIDSSSSKH